MSVKKLFALFAVTLMLAGIFSVLAYADKDKRDNADAQENENTGSEGTAAVESGDAAVSSKVKSIRQTIDERVAKKKEILEKAKRIHEEKKEALRVVKDELKEAREKLKESRKELENLRRGVEKCAGVSSDECKKLRKDTKAFSAKMVDGSIEHVYKMLERSRDAVEKSELGDDEKSGLVAGLDAKLAEMNAMRQKQGQIQAQNTAQEIKNAAKSMKEFWQLSKESIKANNLKISSAKLGGVLVKVDALQARLNKHLEEFRAQGKDTAELDSKVSSFSEKLEAAKQINDEVQSLLGTLDSAEDKSAVMKEATSKMRDAHNLLKEARVVLNSIKESVKAQDTLSAGLQ
jgi:DNA repair exonuclease SbcCD ATPase subunit